MTINLIRQSKKIKVLLLVLISYFLTEQLKAQYFGRNKVQYEDFDFKVLRTSHFDIFHYSETDTTIHFLAELSESWYKNYSSLFQLEFKKRNPLIIYRNSSHFHQTQVIPQLIGIGTGGVTEGYKNRVVMPLAESWESTNHVLGHEMVHAFQYRLLKEDDSLGIQSIANLPLWFVEGLAEYLSIGSYDTQTSMWMADAVLNKDIPSLEQMSVDFKYFPYRYGHSIWSYITGVWGDDVIPELFKESAKKGIDYGVLKVLKVSADSLSKMWKNELINMYTPILEVKTKPSEVGSRVLSPEKDAGKNNLSPSISPDGKFVIYNSEKNVFTFDLFLADAKTGKTIRKLASTSSDSHLSAISFIESSGSWSSDSELFAFVVFADGTNVIHIIDPFTSKIKHKIKSKKIGAISNPRWAPDGNNLVFAGSNGSTTDLYSYNFETKKIIQLTNSRNTDLMPSYSPDGKWLAFITDRTERFQKGKFEYGPLRPALLDLESGNMFLLPFFRYSKHINPEFSPDGKSLYFISDRDGFNNIYKMDLSTQKQYKMTNIATGISGISSNSPALSISKDGTMMFSVFEAGNYIVYSLSLDKINAEFIEDKRLVVAPGLLPPMQRKGKNIVEKYLSVFEPTTLIKDSLEIKKYKPQFSLDFIGNAGIGIGMNQFGAGVGGGVSGIFSDMLNRHMIFTSLQINGQLKDFGGQLAYLNQTKRLNYGGSFSHIPLRSINSFVGFDTTIADGSTVITPVVTQIVQRIYQDNYTFFTYYPISIVKRFEFSLGFTQLSFQEELIQSYLSGNSIFKEEKQKLPSPASIDLYTTSFAYVADNSYYGVIAPLKGYRYRLELGFNNGSFNFITPLLDYRHYIYKKPASFAFRMLEYGRYLTDGDNTKLNLFFIGNESLIRGYSFGSFRASECQDPENDANCPVFDRLFGSKFAVFNFEIRLPFTGPEEISIIKSRYLPLSLNAFLDAGMAWTSDNTPQFKIATNSNQRIPVFSSGVSMRLGVLGYFAIEAYYAHPFQRPEKGSHFGLFISPVW